MTMYLLIYVDDIIVVSSTASAIPKLIAELRSEFSVKDLGVLHYFLGIEVHSPSSGSLVLRQRKYALELLARAIFLIFFHINLEHALFTSICVGLIWS